MLSWFRKPILPIAAQVKLLADCGIRLRPGVTLADVQALPERDALEREGYRATLCALGTERLDGQGRTGCLSDDVWLLDTECIEGPGSYVRVLTRIARMLPVEFPARAIADSIRLDEYRASVSFEIDETGHHWTQRAMDHWLDETLFLRINHLVEAYPFPARERARLLWQVPLGGQHRLIIAATNADGRRLAQSCALAVRTYE